MHELSITQSIVATVAERLGDAPVRRCLSIGRLSGVVPDAIRFCFDLVAAGTSLDGAGWRSTSRAGGRGAGGARSEFETARCSRCARAAARTSSCCRAGSCGYDRWRWRPDVRDVRMRGRDRARSRARRRTVTLEVDVLASNDELAAANREGSRGAGSSR